MRSITFFAIFAYLLPCLFVLAARIPHVDRGRYGGIAIIQARATDTIITTTADPAAEETAASATSHATAKITTSSASNTTTSGTTATATLTTSTPTSSAVNSTDPNALPLQPAITPALGIGGFILIVAGAALAIIGIRNLWIQVFLSTAFLTSVGVAVLIVYVMSPPVRAAVQGAYLVAVFFTGVTFGAVSIVFKELTEGLGCALGGFCSSMWLLSLKPGGLLTDKDAKSGFIAAISLSFYALSFSHYTRPYGLMVSTGISGGTAVSLGIDCFSRAGLKEFWLYIWALNEDIFPLGTNTYPVTRNIRVELAATVIVAILGVISQLRLWKVIRERRQKENEIREKERKKNEEAEIELGRKLEEKNIKERLEWEARYGNASSDIPELADNEKFPTHAAAELEKGQSADAESIASSSEESYRCSDCLERRANGESAYAPSETSDETDDSETRNHEDGAAGFEKDDPEKSANGKVVKVKVFDGAAAARMKDDSSDMTAIVGSEGGSTRSKRLSGRELLDRMPVRSGERLMSQSQEALVSCDSSSAQGTIDGSPTSLSDGHSHATGRHEEEKDSPTSSPGEVPNTLNSQEAGKGEMAESVKDAGKSVGENSIYSREMDEQKFNLNEQDQGKQENGGNAHPEEDREHRPSAPEDKTLAGNGEKEPSKAPEEVEVATEPKEPTKRGDDTPSSETKEQHPDHDETPPEAKALKDEPSKQNGSTSPKKRSTISQSETQAKSKRELPIRLDAETVKRLPQRTSRIVQSYRTNEWAKHLDDAESPDPEPIKPAEEEEPAASDEVQDVVAPVNVEELLQTPLNAQPPPAVERRASLNESSGANENRRMSGDSQVRLNSRSKKKRPRSPQRLSGSSPPQANSPVQPSSPIAQPLSAQGPGVQDNYKPLSPVVDPAEHPHEDTDAEKPQWKGPPPLIAVREGMMKNRLSSFSLSADPWPSRNAPGSEIPYPSSMFPIPEEADDMPLSRRRSMLHQQTASPPPNLSRTATKRSQSGAPSPLNTPASLAVWRESVRENLHDWRNATAVPAPGTGAGTGDRNATRQPQGNPTSARIENSIAEGMQRGDMSDLHREAMRRMQAMANRNRAGLGLDHRFIFIIAFLSFSPPTTVTTTPLRSLTVSPPSPSRLSYSINSSPVSETASFTVPRNPPILSPPEVAESSSARSPPRGRRSLESHQPAAASAYHQKPSSSSRSIPRQKSFWTPSSILRPPSVRLANPVNHVPRITPVTLPQAFQASDDNLPLDAHRDAYPLLTIPERRRSRFTPSPNSLVVERSQAETESGRSSIAVPRGQRRSGPFNEYMPVQEMPDPTGNHESPETNNIRPPDRAHLGLDLGADRSNPLDDRPRHIQSQSSLRSQAQIASIPSNSGQQPGGENEVAEELAWGPAHPCYPHINPHVSIRSKEFVTTRIIRIRRDWMVKGDLAPAFSNLYPEILDPLLPEQEFRKVIANINDKLIKAFDPFSFRNWIDGALALLTGWLWEDIGATGVKSQLKQAEDWLEQWNREVGAKDGVYIWSLRRTAYMSLDIQIPDPKVGIIPSEGGASLPGTRPSSGVGRGY
ncbi:hypothetical protein BDV25DRAFT_141643 [Aspergillus avenaceus]|uniref:Uncharacterized protein n=1 Tax=Aspergillus avenaceus TaxID=36643 RepID=A0A5N6TQK9_ASPAV|nr:hypothetical protein BDV25DRAFT_141643 [Aspergillus avenaceus]